MKFICEHKIVEIDDKLIDISLYLTELKQTESYMVYVRKYLEQSSKFRPHVYEFMSILKECLNLYCRLTKGDQFDIETENQTLKQFVNEFSINDNNEISVNNTSERLSDAYDLLNSKLQNNEYFMKMFKCVLEESSNIFCHAMHESPPIKYDCFQKVKEFLSIESKNRDLKMFEQLPEIMKNNHWKSKWKEWICKDFYGYVDFVEGLSFDMMLKLTRAAIIFQIVPLLTLLSCKLAQINSHLTEDEIRQKYHVPENFRHPIREKIKKMNIEKPWNFV